MRADRVKRSELVVGICGAGLLITLFVPWFGEADAWQALTFLDLLLALVGSAGVAVPVISASNAKTDAPITATTLTTLGGIVAILLVLFRLLDPPGEASREAGAYIGLAATLGLAVAAWRAMSDEGT
jgi:hypothetical protein